MRTYDPSQAPNPQEWSVLMEDRKLHLVRRYHEQEDELPEEVDEELHAISQRRTRMVSSTLSPS